jgi:hypothetical protein
MVIFHFWISIVKDNENWLLVFKNSAMWGGGVSWHLGPMENYSWPKRRKTLDHPVLRNTVVGKLEPTILRFHYFSKLCMKKQK